jgi:hypothetical protein
MELLEVSLDSCNLPALIDEDIQAYAPQPTEAADDLLSAKTHESPLAHMRKASLTQHYTSNSAESYQHQPINLQRDQIRLLRLINPASRTCEPQWDLQIFDISNAPPYVAVSYQWGAVDHPRTISIDNNALCVNENAHEFLQTTSKATSQCSWLWIDSVYNDQTNHSERSHQVLLMSQIYSEAASVLIWLGSSDNNSYCAAMLEVAMAHESTTTKRFLAAVAGLGKQYPVSKKDFPPHKLVEHPAILAGTSRWLIAGDEIDGISLRGDTMAKFDRYATVSRRQVGWKGLNVMFASMQVKQAGLSLGNLLVTSI